MLKHTPSFPMRQWHKYSNTLQTDCSLQGVKLDTSTITITLQYAALFLALYIKNTDKAKFTVDRIQFLMLALPLASAIKEIVDVLVKSLEWDMMSRERSFSVSALPELHS